MKSFECPSEEIQLSYKVLKIVPPSSIHSYVHSKAFSLGSKALIKTQGIRCSDGSRCGEKGTGTEMPPYHTLGVCWPY